MLDLVISIVGLAIPVGVLLPFVLAYYGVFKWHGGWRVAGVIPIVVVFAFFAPLATDWARDPTSHNLWGLVFIPIGLLICAYSLVLVVVRRRHVRNTSLGMQNALETTKD